MLAKPPVGLLCLHSIKSQAQATAVVHIALGQIFQRGRTWGHWCCSFSTSAAGERSGENPCASAPLFLPHQHTYSAMPCLSLETLILAENQPQSKNMTSCSELIYTRQNKGKPTPLISLHRKANMVKNRAALQSCESVWSCHGPCCLTYISTM